MATSYEEHLNGYRNFEDMELYERQGHLQIPTYYWDKLTPPKVAESTRGQQWAEAAEWLSRRLHQVAAAVREMVSETAAKAVAEEKSISVRESSSNASGYVGALKLPSGRFEVRSVGTFDSAYEAAVAYVIDKDKATT